MPPAILRTMKVFLVEDSPLVRERLIEMIEADGLHSIAGHADSYDEALAGIGASTPDVGIFDIKLARGSGINALAEARRRLPSLVGIVLSNHATPQHAKASAAAGAAYFLDKSTEFERIPAILSSIAAGKHKQDMP